MKQTMKIKICGLTMPEEAAYIVNNAVDFCGMVLFYPKSKRNISIEQAKMLMSELDIAVKRVSTDDKKMGCSLVTEAPKKVAVTVSPTAEQVDEIIKCGFDIIQIHGKLDKLVVDNCTIPILRAYNSSDIPEGGTFSDIPELKELLTSEKIIGFLFDASIPGSGKSFDYELLRNIKLGDKLFALAGGLNFENVKDSIERMSNAGLGLPDIVDTSSGVENDNGLGKDPVKIEKFVSAVRNLA